MSAGVLAGCDAVHFVFEAGERVGPFGEDLEVVDDRVHGLVEALSRDDDRDAGRVEQA
jgi:hypothetical protein